MVYFLYFIKMYAMAISVCQIGNIKSLFLPYTINMEFTCNGMDDTYILKI